MRRDYTFHPCGTQEGISSKVDLIPCILTQYFLIAKGKNETKILVAHQYQIYDYKTFKREK